MKSGALTGCYNYIPKEELLRRDEFRYFHFPKNHHYIKIDGNELQKEFVKIILLDSLDYGKIIR